MPAGHERTGATPPARRLRRALRRVTTVVASIAAVVVAVQVALAAEGTLFSAAPPAPRDTATTHESGLATSVRATGSQGPPRAGRARPLLLRSDGGRSLFRLANVGPGERVAGCVAIRYRGKPRVRVRLYGPRTGTGLDRYVDLVVTRGTFGRAPARSCAGFRPDRRRYADGDRGVVFRGTLAAFPTSYARAKDDPAGGSREAWTHGEAHAYRFELSVRDDNAAQGLRVVQSFAWQARSLG